MLSLLIKIRHCCCCVRYPNHIASLEETMLYGKDTISLKDVKFSLETKEKIDHDIIGQTSDSQAQVL